MPAMLSRNPKIFSALAISIGIGLCGYYGLQWYELPRWSEAELAQSVELNLALDLKRMGPLLEPKGKRLETLRQIVRSEVETEINRDRNAIWRGLLAGLVALALGFAGSIKLT